MDLQNFLGYLSGLYFIKPDLDGSELLRTGALVHLLDAALCRVVASQSGRSRHAWTIAGLLLGIWALGALFLLPSRESVAGQDASLTRRESF